MTQTIKTVRGWPPGGYPFEDPKTGMKFDAMSADLRMQTQNVIKHRRANPGIYSPSDVKFFDPLQVQAEIVAYICSKRPEVCGEVRMKTAPYFEVEPGPPHGKVCNRCKSDQLVANYCKSCSGRRITSWKCVKCGFENPK